MDKVKRIIILSFLSFVLVFGVSGCKNNTVVNNDNTIQKEINNQEKINKKEEVRQETKTKATTTEEIATTSIITSNIDTSDWKTYRNEKVYKIEFRYPKDWDVSTSSLMVHGDKRLNLWIEDKNAKIAIRWLPWSKMTTKEHLKNDDLILKNRVFDKYKSYLAYRQSRLGINTKIFPYIYKYYLKFENNNIIIEYSSKDVNKLDISMKEKNLINKIIETIKFK